MIRHLAALSTWQAEYKSLRNGIILAILTLCLDTNYAKALKMKYNSRARPASEEEVLVLTMMGQALLNVQIMQEALSTSITLKMDVGYPQKCSKEEAYGLMEQRLKRTLGGVIKEALENDLYGTDLQTGLREILDERNWLVHKFINNFFASGGKEYLLSRLRAMVVKANKIQQKIEDDLVEFSESKGLDMSTVRQEMAKQNMTFSE